MTNTQKTLVLAVAAGVLASLMSDWIKRWSMSPGLAKDGWTPGPAGGGDLVPGAFGADRWPLGLELTPVDYLARLNAIGPDCGPGDPCGTWHDPNGSLGFMQIDITRGVGDL